MVDFMSDTLFWFFVGMIIFIMELIAPGLILFFFGIGAWITALITAVYPIGLTAQLFVFLVTSIVTLIVLRKRFEVLFKGFSKGKENPALDLDDMTGKKATVTKKIDPPKGGTVEIHGTHWNAESSEIIEEGTTVIIERKKDLTLTVRRIN